LAAENSTSEDLSLSLVVLDAEAYLKGVPINSSELLKLLLSGP
jgi:hypothetical protein